MQIYNFFLVPPRHSQHNKIQSKRYPPASHRHPPGTCTIPTAIERHNRTGSAARCVCHHSALRCTMQHAPLTSAPRCQPQDKNPGQSRKGTRRSKEGRSASTQNDRTKQEKAHWTSPEKRPIPTGKSAEETILAEMSTEAEQFQGK